MVRSKKNIWAENESMQNRSMNKTKESFQNECESETRKAACRHDRRREASRRHRSGMKKYL